MVRQKRKFITEKKTTKNQPAMNFVFQRKSIEIEEDKNSYSSFELEEGGDRVNNALSGLTGAQISLKLQ